MSFLHTDIPDLRGYDTGLALSNLARLQQRQVSLDESTLAEFWELAAAIRTDAEGDRDTVDSILLSLQEPPPDASLSDEPAAAPGAPLRAALTVNRPWILRCHRRTGLYQRLILYRFLTEQEALDPAAAPRDARPVGTSVTPGVRGRIAYMKSSPADKAYLAFSPHIPSCRAADAHSFVDACEEVFNGLCEYCILPLESTDQGRLTAFSRLIVKYNLFIAATCDPEGTVPADAHSVRFGLLRRQGFPSGDHTDVFPWWLPLPALPSPPPTRLEILHTSVSSDPAGPDASDVSDGPTLSDLICAAEFCGLRLLRTDSLPPVDLPAVTAGDLPGDPAPLPLPPVSLTFDASADAVDMTTLLRWLVLEAPDDRILGWYGMI